MQVDKKYKKMQMFGDPLLVVANDTGLASFKKAKIFTVED